MQIIIVVKLVIAVMIGSVKLITQVSNLMEVFLVVINALTLMDRSG